MIMSSLAIYLNQPLPPSLSSVSKEDLFEWCILKDPQLLLLWNTISAVYKYNGDSLEKKMKKNKNKNSAYFD